VPPGPDVACCAWVTGAPTMNKAATTPIILFRISVSFCFR
jgi:hypothetical protein